MAVVDRRPRRTQPGARLVAIRLVTSDGRRVDKTGKTNRTGKTGGVPADPDARTDEPGSGLEPFALEDIEPAPLWDEGIALFLDGSWQQCQRPLTIDDLQRFSVEHATRISDILETLYLLTIYGKWTYRTMTGERIELDEAALDALNARGRLAHDDLDAFSGVWEPAASV